MPAPRLTIKDIARLSGVGKSTVSRVLNHPDTVSQKTRQRVDKIIREHNFAPSKFAQAMRGQSDKIIGIIVSRLDSPSENQAVRAILPALYAEGYDPILMESLLNPTLVIEHLRILRQRHVDGVILFAFDGIDKTYLTGWQHNLVVIAREYPGISSVCYDDVRIIMLLMTQLQRLGCRHISYIGVGPEDETTGRLRHQAYLAACEQQQIRPRVRLGDLSFQSGFRLAPQVITAQTQAVVCASDTIALGAIKYLQHYPRSLKIGCVGQMPLLSFLFPDTLSVNPGYQEAGKAAVRQLTALLNGGRTVCQLVVPCILPAPE